MGDWKITAGLTRIISQTGNKNEDQFEDEAALSIVPDPGALFRRDVHGARLAASEGVVEFLKIRERTIRSKFRRRMWIRSDLKTDLFGP